jgi:hypothetical protein
MPTPKEAYAMGAAAYDRGMEAEDNPFPYGTNPHRRWEEGFEDQIYLESGEEGLEDYYNQ